jgi:cytochrome c553
MPTGALRSCAALSLLAILLLPAVLAAAPTFAPVEVSLDGRPAPPPSASACGFSLVADGDGPQVAFTTGPPQCLAAARKGESVFVTVVVRGVEGPFAVAADVERMHGHGAAVALSVDDRETRRVLSANAEEPLAVSREAGAAEARIRLVVIGLDGDAGVRWRNLRLTTGRDRIDVPLVLAPAPSGPGAPPVLPAYRPAIEQALVEWDWRMQDGIGTGREPSTCAAAVDQTLRRGDRLLAGLRDLGVELAQEGRQWDELHRESRTLAATDADSSRSPAAWENLWRRAHALRRRIALSHPLVRGAPVAFVKQVPSAFSHQLTQYYGRYAKPGGGVFVLERPGESMRCRPLTAGRLPEGSCQHLDVSFDADRLLFAFCPCDTAPVDVVAGHRGRYYHLYEIAADGSGLKELTTGPFDDFAPRDLPDGRLVFISTRRQGWHRCGNPGCENYTLALADAGGANPRPVSCHETQEWDPAVLNDGRIAYTRWDYVDRHAVYYEQLWTVRTDGSGPAAFYGNNTFNPVGTWEPRAVPGSHRVMATAAAHHAMTAGSIVLIDPARGIDGLDPLTRLTPDAPFPESETTLAPNWRGPVPAASLPAPVEARRWPGHSYRSPFPLSETHFLAAYGFDTLVGEPKANAPNLFGLYLVDAYGNKELLYRDLNIASLWPAPLRPRPRPPVVTKAVLPGPVDGADAAPAEGVYFVQDVHVSAPVLPRGSVKRLRVVQVLPKSTPGINNPTMGLANASPGKQVLGTVPVESDGSAFFRAPAGVPLSFQALDAQGQAVQIMRSVTYLQPGEAAACVGCHEHRMTAPPPGARAAALAREPSALRPGPDGSRPLSYPILVQPVLDRKCVGCHRREDPQGNVILTGEPQGRYTASYNAMAPRVPFPQWTGGDFRRTSSEPLSTPDFFGARGSPLMRELLKGHRDVTLDPDDVERLATWMDANALFYGTFDPADQARQLRGERIRGPALE